MSGFRITKWSQIAFLISLIVIAGTFLSSCQSLEPIIIYITPTPAATTASQTITPPTTELAGIVTSTPTPIPTIVGPVTGPDYQLPTSPPATSPPVVEATQIPPMVLTQQALIPDLDPSQIGIQIDHERSAEEWAYALDRATQLGVGWIKLQISWRRYQEDGPDQPWDSTWQELEDLLVNADQRGINVLISIAKAPLWARSTNVEDGPPDDPQALASFLTRFFGHKGGETVDAVEVWNEPNLLREWQGQPLNGASYMRYFAAAYQAIRAISPTMLIITAGLAPTSDSDVSRNDRAFLQEMYSAGLANYREIYVGIHPYGWGNLPDARCCDPSEARGWDDDPHFFFMDNINDMRAIMEQNGHADVQFWVTEFGWATWDGYPSDAPEPWMNYINRWDQAFYTLRAFQIGQERSDIGVMFLWNLNFGAQREVERRDERTAYAIVPFVGIRPAFWMIYDAVHPDVVLDGYERDG